MWTTVVSSILLMTVFGSSLSEENHTSLTNIKPLLLDFKKNVHQILEGARILKKRQLEDSDSSNYKMKIANASPEDLPYLSTLNVTFWIAAYAKDKNQILIGTAEGQLRLFELSLDSDKSATQIAQSELEDAAINAKAFLFNEEQWFAVLHKSDQEYYIQMYLRDGRSLEKKQKINLSGFSDIQLVTMRGIHYLVVASYSSQIGSSFSYQATVTLYKWPGTQFDAIAWRTVHGARSVDCWALDGSLYIVVAQEMDDEGNLQIGSPIFLYNSKEQDRLVLWEALQTVGPRKVQHFHVANSHYLVIIGKEDAAVYWWSTGQFLKWQTLPYTAGATDVSVISLGNGEVSIVIALQDQAIFYTLDSSGLYIISLDMRLRGRNLSSFQFISSGKSYYALAVFPDIQPIYKLTIGSHYLPTIKSLDPLGECLSNIKELLEERQAVLDTIKSDLDRVWLKGSNQTVTTKITVEGKISSNQPSQVRNVIILRFANIPDVPMAHVIAALANVGELAEDAKIDVDGAVTKSTRQEIRGINHFEYVAIPSLTMEYSSDDITINGVPISSLQNYALRKTGDQVFSARTSVTNIHSQTARMDSLNGILIDDFLLLHGVQTVSGYLTFPSVFATDVFVERLNSIPTEDMVTTNIPQDIQSLKTFISLQSNSIDVSGETNEVDLSGISNRIATFDKYNEFSDQLTFLNPLTINGDMFLTQKINKVVDLEAIVQRTVKLDAEQDLIGHYTFKGKQIATGDLLVNGLINGVSLDDFMTLSSHQKIYADMTFSQPLVIERDLVVDQVNGVDLSEEALLKSAPYQFITGRKIFSEDIQADFVDMTEYITLDGVDPSFLLQDIIKHTQGIVDQNETVLNNVEVLNTLTILGEVNGINIEDFASSVWLKSTDQEIIDSISIQYLHSKNDIDATTVNGLNLELDVVHTSMDEVIEGQKTFTFKTIAKSIESNGTINGIDLKSYEVELEKYRNEWEVQGTKFITSLSINGNLELTKLNQLNVTDIMRPDTQQMIYGPVTLKELAIIQGNSDFEAISSVVLNGLNLQEFFRNAVLSTQSYKPLMNKNFKLMTAKSLIIPPSSKISGVPLSELLQRTVTLNDSQVITAPKIFTTDLKFHKLVNANNVNGLNINDYLAEVVLTDEISRISNKYFGNIKTSKASIGLINGIRIEDLAANVFYKSEDNVVSEHFTFEGDVDVGDIFASKIDGISWIDLVFLQKNEVLDKDWFLSNMRTESDIFVKGLVNGCDLSEISNVLYSNESTQVIKKKVNVQNVIVFGNLIVVKTINNVPLEDLKNLITLSGDQIIESNVIIDASLRTKELNLWNNINNEDLISIIQDAVRHSADEEIYGEKTFRDGMDLAFLTGNLFASKINGVDIEELESTTVWKNGHQEIAGDKILTSLILNVAIINGYLNGLKLPEDIIKTDVSEHISHPTYLMSDVYVSTNIVIYGLVDSVDLNTVIDRRVTLSTEQNITSGLIFKDDIVLFDEMIIDGTVNDIVLELVAKLKPVYPIQGYKIFKELHTAGSVVTSSVNELNIVELSENILQYNRNEHVNEVQVFERPIHIHSSIFVEWINNVPMHQLAIAFNTLMSGLQSALVYLKDLSSNLQQQLNLMSAATQDQVYKYAYFTLFQELDVGPTNRILYGYDFGSSDHEFSHSLVVWTEHKHCIFMEKCCHEEFSNWLRVTKNGIVMADSSVDSGRYFPIRDPSSTTDKKEFFIWTNSTAVQSEWCPNKDGRMILAINEGGLQRVYLDIESSALLSDVKSFSKGNLFTVANFFYDPKTDEYGSTVVYTFGERFWSEYQILPSFGILSMDLITFAQEFKEEILLALGTGMKTDPGSYSSVYKWNNNVGRFELLQSIPSQFITSTLWIRKGKDLLLAMSGVDYWPKKAVDCGEQVSGGQIDIFLYKEHLEWIQSIPVAGIISMVSFSVDGDTYLAAASIQYQTIYIFEWKGFSGFVQIHTISAAARHLNIYSVDDDIYMTVASVSGPSKILKLIRKGKTTRTIQSFNLITSEQHDGIPREPCILPS